MFLPSESLVPFTAKQLANAQVVYNNPAYGRTSEEWLERFAYLIPNDQIPADQFLPKEKSFLAERYGGARIVTHGGGVRCGLDGDFSVKGMGCNPLMGRDAQQKNPFYSNGTLSFSAAIQEAAWGNVLHTALPFGAVRVAALILTGTNTSKGADDHVCGALVVREAVLRPAHFERAVYFRPQAGVPLVHDTERVKQAIAHLPRCLPMPDEIPTTELERLSPLERLNMGLKEMAKRFADQSAVAVSRRLVHGALTASNIALDGRWLDFGTALSFSTYANATLGRNIPPLWEEYASQFPVLQNLCFYIGKYFPAADRAQLPQAEALLQTYLLRYQSSLIDAFLGLTGFPAPLWHSMPNADVKIQLAQLLIHTARLGVEKVCIAARPDWERFGPNRLGRVLPILACWSDHDTCDERLSSDIDDKTLRTALIHAYRKAAHELLISAQKMGIQPHSLRRLIYLQASKSLKQISAIDAGEIYRRYLQEESPRPGELQSFIDRVSDESEVCFQPASSFNCLMWKGKNRAISYDAGKDHWVVTSEGNSLAFPWEAVRASKDLAPIREYWGTELCAGLIERESTLDSTTFGAVCNG